MADTAFEPYLAAKERREKEIKEKFNAEQEEREKIRKEREIIEKEERKKAEEARKILLKKSRWSFNFFKKEEKDVLSKKSADSSAKKQEEDMKNWMVWIIVAALVIFIVVDKGCNKKMGNVNPTAAATVTETVVPVPASSETIKNGGSSVEVDVKVKVSGNSAAVKSADVSGKPVVAKVPVSEPVAKVTGPITGNAIAVFNDYSSDDVEIHVYGKRGLIAKVLANQINVNHYTTDTLAVRVELHKSFCPTKILWEKKLAGGVCVIKCNEDGFVATNDQSILPPRKG